MEFPHRMATPLLFARRTVPTLRSRGFETTKAWCAYDEPVPAHVPTPTCRCIWVVRVSVRSPRKPREILASATNAGIRNRESDQRATTHSTSITQRLFYGGSNLTTDKRSGLGLVLSGLPLEDGASLFFPSSSFVIFNPSCCVKETPLARGRFDEL
jgi:hypothetical protein